MVPSVSLWGPPQAFHSHEYSLQSVPTIDDTHTILSSQQQLLSLIGQRTHRIHPLRPRPDASLEEPRTRHSTSRLHPSEAHRRSERYGHAREELASDTEAMVSLTAASNVHPEESKGSYPLQSEEPQTDAEGPRAQEPLKVSTFGACLKSTLDSTSCRRRLINPDLSLSLSLSP